MQRIPYTEVVPKWDDIASTIHSTLHDIGTDGMVLTFSEFTPTDPDTQRRNDAARLTWPSLGARLMPYFGNRTSKQIGDPRSMPYVRDMLDAAFSNGTDRIAVITNNDILFDNRLHESIERGCNDCGCWWAYRLASPQNPATDHGADLFAMTRQWWFEHRHLYPDFLIGFAWWDDIMVRMMRWSGCLGLEPLYYHEPHPPAMTTRGHTAGMKHNEQLALPWLNEHHELHQKPES
jgi:hypothetical protein